MLRGVGTATWSPGSLNGDLKSHENKKLKDHLQGVVCIAKDIAAACGIGIDPRLLESVGWTHDLAKVHPAFQCYLRGGTTRVEHSRPSSYFTLSLTGDWMAAEVVRRHHTKLQDVEAIKGFWAGDHLQPEELNSQMQQLVPGWQQLFTQDKWYDFVDWINLDMLGGANEWLELRTLYSIFITADRMDALGVSKVGFGEIPEFVLPVFSARTEMNCWRTAVREKCLMTLPDKVSPGIYTLTMPTGSGKTITGLQIARDFAAKLEARSIVYALPFIAIVEQNASVARKVFGSYVQEDHSGFFHITEEDDESGRNPLKRMSSLFRYWAEPVVVTTLAALWSACFDPRANASVNFHRLHRAVVVLDEPQSIRPELWKGFGLTMEFLAKELGTVFLLMTATQPLIGRGLELAVGVKPFPKPRHIYEYLNEKVPMKDLGHLLKDCLPTRNGCGLMVFNTKKSAYRAWKSLQGHLDGPVLFLSRSMAPLHRRATMKHLRYLRERGIRHHLVATQVVEAGVDLDFDWVFRDMGPLDSVIQVAGRCNRHFNLPTQGRVLLAEMVSADNRPFHSYVYSKVLTDSTKHVLSGYKTFSEHQVPALVDEYYNRVLSALHHDDCFQRISTGKWGSLPRLIERTDFYEAPVFVELDEGLLPLLDELEHTKWSYDTQDRVRYLRRRASQYVIEVPLESLYRSLGQVGRVETTGKHPPLRNVLNEHYWLLSRDAIGVLYHSVAGYIPPSFLEDDIGNFMY